MSDVKPLSECDPYWRCYEWAEGRVLCAADIADLQQVLNDYNDEIGTQAHHYDDARRQVLFEIGGQELVDAADKADEAQSLVTVKRAMAHYEAKRAEYEAKA